MMAIITWMGIGANLTGNWSTGADWSTLALPTSADTATISQLGSAAYTVSEDTTALIGGLTVGAANATLAFNAPIQLTVTGPTTLTAGTINISTTATLATGTFTDNNAGHFTESAGTLNVTGVGTAFLAQGSGSSFTLSGGAVAVANDAGFAGGIDAISGGTFSAGTVTASGSLLTLSGGTTTSAGATTLTSGSIIIQSPGTLSTASLAASGGTFLETAGQFTASGL